MNIRQRVSVTQVGAGGDSGPAGLETEDLVRRCQKGDRLALEALIVRHQTYVFRLCCLVMRNEQDAEDMTQETFVRACRALPRYQQREGSSFEAWLYRIAVNCCRSRMRRKWYQVLPWPEPAPQIVAEPEDQPERKAVQSEWRTEMLDAIDSLGEKHRLVVILRYYAGMSNEEIAETIGVPSGTVRSRLHTARERLRQVLEEHEVRAAQRPGRKHA
ncbi:MAG TPA: sigma-70 family RNA polymerase sigma factor [Anaerolineae bacterium]|nr:sigma-70 family RNA polymerase sigma factor [Anaerolineae bacterium]